MKCNIKVKLCLLKNIDRIFNGAKTGKFCVGAILELYFMSEILT
jgi:hypothetical protein